MNGRYSDHEVKVDADRLPEVGAILCSGLTDFTPDATAPGDRGDNWMTLDLWGSRTLHLSAELR